jgi:8-oxo-dGTP pyrophosphatase MutT (NUDIX family)
MTQITLIPTTDRHTVPAQQPHRSVPAPPLSQMIIILGGDFVRLTAILVPPNIRRMARTEYYHDVAAPQAQQLLPAAFAVVRNSSGRILLVRRADDGYWELPGGRIEVGESASAAVIREVAEEADILIKVTRVAGVYSDPAHVLAYPHKAAVYQQFAVCFHAISTASNAQPDHHETTAAAWFDPEQTTQLSMHPAMRQRLANALTEPHQAHFD